MVLEAIGAGRLVSLRGSRITVAWQWAIIAGVVVMAVYLLLLPLVTRTWRATGDEPHYLLAAHSLGIDRDLDLANNYGPPPGAAESMFGRILKKDFSSHRDETITSTKAGYWMWPGPYGDGGYRKYMLSSLDQSLASDKCPDVPFTHIHRYLPSFFQR